MYAVVKVIMPEKLTKEQKSLFESLANTELDNSTVIKKYKKFLKDNDKQTLIKYNLDGGSK